MATAKNATLASRTFNKSRKQATIGPEFMGFGFLLTFGTMVAHYTIARRRGLLCQRPTMTFELTSPDFFAGAVVE